ncbi:hypothetical protein BaRGS_00012329 [Batillaria attramentaria]|uniref:Polo kinase n=1 Tax=Batillaria attramentaria TaxID=370345 RepID=A0ABD0LBR9_9CAEN
MIVFDQDKRKQNVAEGVQLDTGDSSGQKPICCAQKKFGDGVTSRTKPRQLNTTRLKPYRQLSILEMGHVSLEFLKRKDGQERVAEVFVVSGDGVQVYVEQWQAGCPPSSDAALEQAWHTFTYHDLPEKYWKKYAHAYRFVDLVKSKTPKVTMYTDHAKGVLMENWPPSFEVTFYHAGPTIVMTGNDVHIREDNGASLVFSKDCLNNLVSDYTLGLIRHATQMREQCFRLEASVATAEVTNQTGEPLFPITVGARPSTSICSSTSSTSESLDPPATKLLLSSLLPRALRFFPRPPRSPRFTPGVACAYTGPQCSRQTPTNQPIIFFLLSRRSVETPRKTVPPSHPSPVKERVQSSLSSASPAESPYRHVSTLEGRKMRRQLSSASTESSGMEENTACSVSDTVNSCPQVPNDVAMHSVSFDKAAANFHPQSLENNQERFQFAQPAPFRPAREEDELLKNVAHSSPHKGTPMLRSPIRCQANQPSLSNIQTSSPFTSAMNTTSAATLRSISRDFHTTDRSGGDSGAMSSHADFVSCTSSAVADSLMTPPSGSQCPAVGASCETSPDMSTSSSVVRQTFVPYTGWASQLASGAVWIRYNDGTQLGVHNTPAEIVYVDQEGQTHRYVQSDGISEVVRLKLEKLPMVLDCLMTRPAAPPYGMASS